uniref:Protein Wnt n=1 Tax=Halisarca dujardinii TaxID=2583056 RepID=A0A175C2Q2_HALDU
MTSLFCVRATNIVLLAFLSSFVAERSALQPHCDSCNEFGFVKLSVDPDLVDANGIVVNKLADCMEYDEVLSPQQMSVCLGKGSRYLSCFALGMRKAVNWCGRVFNQSKWNCSHAVRQLVFGNIVHTMNLRERAAVLMMISASVMMELTTCCREALLQDCSCHFPPDILRFERIVVNGNATYIYAGCSDRLDIPAERTKQLLDVNSNVEDEEPCDLADRHNVEAGIKMASVTTRSCHCHGLTAACNIQTCKHRILRYSNVANQMLEKYSGAVKVQKEAETNQLLPANALADPPTSGDLVFFCDSPDYSVANASMDIPGTKDRLCDPSKHGLGSCDLFCGGRGYYKRTITTPIYERHFDFNQFKIVNRIVRYETNTKHFCN